MSDFSSPFFSVFLLVNNPYNSQVYLCVAVQKSVFLYQWYEPWGKFMKVQVIFSSVQIQTFHSINTIPIYGRNLYDILRDTFAVFRSTHTNGGLFHIKLINSNSTVCLILCSRCIISICFYYFLFYSIVFIELSYLSFILSAI